MKALPSASWNKAPLSKRATVLKVEPHSLAEINDNYRFSSTWFNPFNTALLSEHYHPL